MHIHFLGIGGAGIGPLALIAHQAGYKVSGSDKINSNYVEYLKTKGIEDISIGQDGAPIEDTHGKNPIDWIVCSSAVFIENPNHPSLEFAGKNNIKATKRDEFLSNFIEEKNLKLIAIAGTHGKTTTTAMAIWLFQELDLPISYSVGAKIPFGDMGHYDSKSEYFLYECDEFDRNFLAFHPYVSLIAGIDYDHQEIYPTEESYQEAFRQFLSQSKQAYLWQSDSNLLYKNSGKPDNITLIKEDDSLINDLSLPGEVNRKDAALVLHGAKNLTSEPADKLAKIMDEFPGLSRRFEELADNLYSDYAHTIPKIKGALQLAGELPGDVVIVYEPLTNRRQHYIRGEYKDLFRSAKKLYWVPSYLTREDPDQHVITPQEFIDEIDKPKDKEAAKLDDKLKSSIQKHLAAGDTVICLSGGGGGSLDEWIRKELK